MLDAIKDFLAELINGDKDQQGFADHDYRVAAAALLVHVATTDGRLSEAERGRLAALLQARFELDAKRTTDLIAAAEAADREAIDFYQFTRVLMRSLDDAGRQRIVEMMWEMALADGDVSEFEDNVLWRIADLLAISGPQRVALRQRVADCNVGAEGAD